MGDGESPETAVWLLPISDGRAAFTSGSIAFAHEGSELVPVARRALERAAQRLQRVALRDLVNVVRADPLPVVAARARQTAPGRRPDPSTAPSDGGEAGSAAGAAVDDCAWRSFSAGREHQRATGAHLLGSVVHVLHADNECLFGDSPPNGGVLAFHDHMKTEARRAVRDHGPGSGGPNDGGRDADEEVHWNLLTTGLGLDALQTGAAHRLEGTLAEIGGRRQLPDLVVVSPGCLAKTVGDAVEPALAAAAQQGLRGCVEGYGSSPHAAALNEALPRLAADRRRPRPDSVNLIGYPPFVGLGWCISLLESAGVHLNGTLLPAVDTRALTRFPEAALLVVYEPLQGDPLVCRLREELPRPSIVPPAPYGVARCARWLSDISAGLLHCDVTRAEEAWQRVWDEQFPEWERLQRSAGKHRLGVVLGGQGVADVDDTTAETGVPVIQLIEEMGFELDLFVHASATPPAAATTGVRRLIPFADETELAAALRASDADAVYSEMTFDRRLASAGKARFSLSVFEMGLPGAVRALRRILGLCRAPFYRRYGRHLGRPLPWQGADGGGGIGRDSA